MKQRNNRKTRFLAVLLTCLLLSASILLGACNEGAGDDPLFSTEATARKTNATRATLATEAVDDTPVPHLIPEILEENTNQVIGRLSTPVVRQINSKIDIKLQYQGWPTVCAGDGDTLYAVSSVRLTHIDPFGCIGFYKSEDGGKTWSDVEIIVDTPIDDRDAGIVYLGDNRVLVSWFTHDVSNYVEGGEWYESWANHADVSKSQRDAVLKKLANLPAAEKQAGSYVMLSPDGGKTWEMPVQVPISAPHGPTLMRDGKTLIYFGDPHNPSACGEVGLNSNRYYVYISPDFGKTWVQRSSLGLPTVSGFRYDEPHILQLRDGSYIAAIRGQKISGSNDSLCCFISHSSDGRKWSNFEALKGTVGTPPHFFQTKEGILVISYSYRLDPCGARGRISYDNGYTWSDEIIFSKSDTPWDGDLGYASTTQLPDGTMITAYYQKKEEDTYCSFLFTRWRLVEENETT